MDRMQNHTPATFATSQIAGQKRQRNREPISCQPCRSRKVACDREEPCGSCVKQKTVDKCSYRKPDLPSPDSDAQRPPTTAPRSNARSGKDINVDSRLDRVERAVDNLVALVESGNYANASSTQSRPSVDTNPLSFSYQNYKFDDRPPSVENPYSQGSLSAKSSELVYFVGPGGWTTQRLDVIPYLYCLIGIGLTYGRSKCCLIRRTNLPDNGPLSLTLGNFSSLPNTAPCYNFTFPLQHHP